MLAPFLNVFWTEYLPVKNRAGERSLLYTKIKTITTTFRAGKNSSKKSQQGKFFARPFVRVAIFPPQNTKQGRFSTLWLLLHGPWKNLDLVWRTMEKGGGTLPVQSNCHTHVIAIYYPAHSWKPSIGAFCQKNNCDGHGSVKVIFGAKLKHIATPTALKTALGGKQAPYCLFNHECH